MSSGSDDHCAALGQVLVHRGELFDLSTAEVRQVPCGLVGTRDGRVEALSTQPERMIPV